MAYCVHCGLPLQPADRFCASCGATVPDPAPPAPSAPHTQPAAQMPSSGPFSAQPARVTQQPNPFSAIPVGDYVRDGLAALSLITSLFMIWQYDPNSGGQTGSVAAARIDVILITLVSLLSLGITYLWRAGVFGPTWDYTKTQNLRLLANAPYAILVIVYLVIEVFARQGLGPAVAFGLAGAILAAQPRRAELADGDTMRDRRWVVIAVGIAGLVTALTVAQIIEMLVQNPGNDVGYVALTVLMGAADAALLVTVAAGVAHLSDGWRLTGIGVGIAAAVLGLLSLSPGETFVTLTFFSSSPSFSLAFWIAFGAAVSAPSVARLMKTEVSAAAPWLSAVSAVLKLTIGLNALMGLVSIIALIQQVQAGSGQDVPWVLALFFGGVNTVAGIVVLRATAVKDSRQGQVLATGYAGLLFVLGLVLVIVWSVQPVGVIPPLPILIAFVIPAGLAGALWGPTSVRRRFNALPAGGHPGTSGFTFNGTQQVQPEQPFPPEGGPQA
jgi:hypothetical protein